MTADVKTSLMELHDLGPCKLFDTAGLDEPGELGAKKRAKVGNDQLDAEPHYAAGMLFLGTAAAKCMASVAQCAACRVVGSMYMMGLARANPSCTCSSGCNMWHAVDTCPNLLRCLWQA